MRHQQKKIVRYLINKNNIILGSRDLGILLIFIVCFISIGNAQPQTLYLKFNEESQDIGEYDWKIGDKTVTYFIFYMIEKNQSYSEAMRLYLNKSPDKNFKKSREDSYILFSTYKVGNKKYMPLKEYSSIDVKTIDWLRQYYFKNASIPLKEKKSMYLSNEFEQDFDTIYIVKVDSSNQKINLQEVNYNMPFPGGHNPFKN